MFLLVLLARPPICAQIGDYMNHAHCKCADQNAKAVHSQAAHV